MRRETRLLLVGLVGAATTANAIRPVRRTGPLSVAAFISGMPASELPLHAALSQGLLAALSARAGGLRATRGQVGAGLTAASCAGLMQVYRESDRALRTLEQALAGGLGSDYRSRITDSFAPPAEERLTWLNILLPDLTVRRRYRVARDLPYGEHGRRNMLDIWRRADLDRDAAAPVLFQIHGGGWVTGAKEGQGEPLMAHLAGRGWVCVAPNYRLSPKATWPDHIVDVKRALAWVKSHISEYGGDPGFVVATGGSAGGQLAALIALTPGFAEWQPGFEDADTSVAAAVTFYGVYDFLNRHGTGRDDMAPWLERRLFKSAASEDRARWDQASPISHVGPAAPPFFILHGKNDSLYPVEQARDFARELRKVSASPVVYAELTGAQHAFDVLPSPRALHAVHAVDRFLAVVRSEHDRKAGAGTSGATR